MEELLMKAFVALIAAAGIFLLSFDFSITKTQKLQSEKHNNKIK